MLPFDVSEKPQGASGLDIDERTIDNKRVIGEVKSTTPYAKNDFGSAQKKSFLADFRKLNAAEAEHKFLFVTDERTYEIIKRRYQTEIPDVTVVLLANTEP